MFDDSIYQELISGLGVDLPQDYVNFMRSYSGVPPEASSFWVVRDDWGTEVEDFFVIARSDQHRSVFASGARVHGSSVMSHDA